MSTILKEFVKMGHEKRHVLFHGSIILHIVVLVLYLWLPFLGFELLLSLLLRLLLFLSLLPLVCGLLALVLLILLLRLLLLLSLLVK